MGAGQSNKQSNVKGKSHDKKTLFDSLKILIQDVEYYIEDQIKKRMQEVIIQFPDETYKQKQLFEPLVISVPPQIKPYEDVLLNSVKSFFQYTILNQCEEKNGKIDKLNMEFVRDFRLMDFKSLDKYEKKVDEYESQLIMLFKMLRGYCLKSQQIIKQLSKDKEMQCWAYVIIWEHFQNNLPHIAKQYHLLSLNDAFDSKYSVLLPHLKVESLGGKLWGTIVSPIDIDFVLTQFSKNRLEKSFNLPYSQIFNAILDLSIDQQQLQYIGISDFKYPQQVEKIINYLKNDSEKIYSILLQDAKGNLEEFLKQWKLDNEYLKAIFPDWIIETQIDVLFFRIFEDKLVGEVKLLQPQDQKILVEQYSKPVIQSDFMSQLRGFNNLNQMSFIPFQNYVQQHKDPILKILVKQLLSDKQFSSVILSSKSTENRISEVLIDQQQLSDIMDIENPQQCQSQVVELQTQQLDILRNKQNNNQLEIEKISQKYDEIKNVIEGNIEARDSNVKQRNYGKIDVPENCLKVFDFQNQISSQDIQEIISSLAKENERRSKILQSSFGNGGQNLKGNLAAQLLYSMEL